MIAALALASSGCTLYFDTPGHEEGGWDGSEPSFPSPEIPPDAEPQPWDPNQPPGMEPLPWDPTRPPPDDQTGGWIAESFRALEGTTQCAGARFVRYVPNYNVWVGAVLCGDDAYRYKLYMSDSRTGAYYDIADYAGHGQDHCELINPRFSLPNEDDITSGGCADCAVGEVIDVTDVPVFARGVLGEQFQQGTSGFWGDLTTDWYACGVPVGPSAPVPPPPSGEWLQQEFQTYDGIRYCEGPRFVRFSAQYGLWVGAELCERDRATYKLYLSDSQSGTYYEIADFAGHGQDHCELVNGSFRLPNEDDITSGGCTNCAVGEVIDLISVPVYARAVFGEPFQLVRSTDWGDLTTPWYRCGATIP